MPSAHRTPMLIAVAAVAASLTVLQGCIVVVGNRGGSYEPRSYTNDGTRTKRIGVELDRVSNTLASQLEVDGDHACVITRVALNSSAEKAGLQRHDVIVAIDGRPKASIAAIREAVNDGEPGDTITLTVKRGGASVEVPVQIERR